MNAVNDKIYCEEEEEQVFGSLHFLFQAMQSKKWYFVILKQGMETKHPKDRERTTKDNHRAFKNDPLEDIGRILNDQNP